MRPIVILFAVLFFGGCNSNNQGESNKDKNSANDAITQNQLNITLLLDLSDRIDPATNPDDIPEHYKRDIEIVNYFTDFFVKDMEKRGTFMAKGKLRVMFSPIPSTPNVNLLASKLSVDLSKMDSKQKKVIHDNLSNDFKKSINMIYNETLMEKRWYGSDIWRFFKNDVKNCIDTNSIYRNILVILTDGYIYHKDSKDQIGNRYAYLIPENISKYKLRNNNNWEQVIINNDFGLITKQNNLTNLEVLVLEVTPSKTYLNDEDIIKYVLNKWFDEMNIKKRSIHNTNLPQYTKQYIDEFMK